jgi:hypothetical protein
MIPADLLQLEASEAVSAVGLRQANLVERFLQWKSQEFVADLFLLRAEADQAIHAEARARGAVSDLAGYPVGFCKRIRDFGLHRLVAAGADDTARPALSAVAAFRAAGGLVKGVWGVQKGIYFQNAIQIGNLWCDLSNDTVDPRRPAVEVCLLADARFEELASFEQFAEVAGCYWEEEAYPTHLFPAIAAVLPVILVSRSGRMRLPAPKTLLPRNLRLDYSLADAFLGSSEYASRKLPEPVLEHLTRASRRRTGWFAAEHAWCRRFEPALGPADAGRLIAAERAAVAGLSERDTLARFFEIIHCTTGLVTGGPVTD